MRHSPDGCPCVLGRLREQGFVCVDQLLLGYLPQGIIEGVPVQVGKHAINPNSVGVKF